MRASTAILAMFPTAAVADGELVTKYGPLLEKCYSEATDVGGKAACIGVASDACIAEEDGGSTTLGMSMCLQSEATIWDRFLNEEYVRTRDWAREMDEDDAEYFPEYANRASTLQDAQRAWITFRDAECKLAYAVWGSGSMRHIAGTNCILDETASRTIGLWTLGDMMR